jgi:hypothetical protein
LLVDAKVTPLVEPSDGVRFWVWCYRQSQPLDDLCWDEVLLATTTKDEVQQSTIHPHLLMKYVFIFLWFIKFIGLDLGGINSFIGFFANDFSPFFWF